MDSYKRTGVENQSPYKIMFITFKTHTKVIHDKTQGYKAVVRRLTEPKPTKVKTGFQFKSVFRAQDDVILFKTLKTSEFGIHQIYKRSLLRTSHLKIE